MTAQEYLSDIAGSKEIIKGWWSADFYNNDEISRFIISLNDSKYVGFDSDIVASLCLILPAYHSIEVTKRYLFYTNNEGGLTQEEVSIVFNKFIAAHPEVRTYLKSNVTVVKSANQLKGEAYARSLTIGRIE